MDRARGSRHVGIARGVVDLHEDLATGQLVLKCGRVSKTGLDLLNGNPVSTASTPRDETRTLPRLERCDQ